MALMRQSALRSNGSTALWRKIRARILNRDGHSCQMCGQEATTVDHIIPRKVGGQDNDDNLQALCNRCNTSKGGRFFESAKTPLTLLGSFIPKNDTISHYPNESG